jgi:putative membrane protein
MRQQLVWILVAAAVTLSSFVGAPYPRELVLQHLPTFSGLAGLALIVRRYDLPVSVFASLLGFWALHLIGARWLYSYVPYDDWFRLLLGGSPSEWFGWRRNHYDRFVHLMFGALAMPVICRLTTWFQQRPGVTPAKSERLWVLMQGWIGVIALSALYEIVEWGVAIAFSPETAESYNGQQGDLWDAQKDMALATVGAALVVVGQLAMLTRPGRGGERSSRHSPSN